MADIVSAESLQGSPNDDRRAMVVRAAVQPDDPQEYFEDDMVYYDRKIWRINRVQQIKPKARNSPATWKYELVIDGGKQDPVKVFQKDIKSLYMEGPNRPARFE